MSSGDPVARAKRKHLHNGSFPALLELSGSLNDEAMCLLCFERDHAMCHRDVIVDSLRKLEPELTVRHL